jgi:hypothetical protein
MSVSESFAKLKEQLDEAERTVSAAVTQNDADVKAKVDEARRNADSRAAELRTKTQDGPDLADSGWRQVQRDWDRHIESARKRIDARKADVDVMVAASESEQAEADARDAIDFAGSAIEEAEYAVLDALLAEKKLDLLGGSGPEN